MSSSLKVVVAKDLCLKPVTLLADYKPLKVSCLSREGFKNSRYFVFAKDCLLTGQE